MATKIVKKIRDPDILCYCRTITSAGRTQERLEKNDEHGYVTILPHTCGFKLRRIRA